MGLLSGLLDNAGNVSKEKIKEEYDFLFAKDETVLAAYKLVRDSFIFTDKRLILLDIQGITGKKVEALSIPYRSITRFAVETAGHFDLEAELKIWLSGTENPIEKKFNRSVNIYEVQSILAGAIAD
ncbi:MAG: PH domain-containing protein [Synergistaceae bacterium]|jgi:hypothetical protein|nr:PH domain-containing protein [Synergistaceae bacterium]